MKTKHGSFISILLFLGRGMLLLGPASMVQAYVVISSPARGSTGHLTKHGPLRRMLLPPWKDRSTRFSYLERSPATTTRAIRRSSSCMRAGGSTNSDEEFTVPSNAALDRIKADLVRLCTSGSGRNNNNKPTVSEILDLVAQLETTAEQVGIGQSSTVSGLLSGEWELLYASEDETRSSPFFWAFRQAFPENADQVFGITDSIPAPIKEIGPAYQQIEYNTATQKGKFVSKVKVATLGGIATSIMTTRGTIVGLVGVDGIRLKIETTKPEQSTIISKLLGPLGDVVNENIPAFPSGEALERIRPGSSEVVMRTTFCDDALRVSRNDARYGDFFVWRRREFANYEFL